MTRKLVWTGIALFGITLALGSNAWADQDRGGRGHRNDNGYHQKHKNPPGHHFGWHKGKGNPHKDRYHRRPAYRDRDHHDRGRYPRGQHSKRVVERHIYHHYTSDDRCDDDRFNLAISVIDEFLGVAVAVSGSR